MICKNLQPYYLAITQEMFKCCGNAWQEYNFHLGDQKKKYAEKNWQPKSNIKSRYKEDSRTFLQKSSESLDIEFVKLMKQVESSTVAPSFISRTHALMRKSEEQQGEH